jgi:hypothetical protein
MRAGGFGPLPEKEEFMSEYNPFAVETVRIQDGNGGFVVINKSDFDAEQHKLYVEKAAKKQASQGDA